MGVGIVPHPNHKSFFGGHWYPCYGLLVMFALGFTDTPVLDFWWCLPWVSLIPLFWISGDICPGFHWYPCFGLLVMFAVGFTDTPVLDFWLCLPWVSLIPLFWTSGYVCPRFQSQGGFLTFVLCQNLPLVRTLFFCHWFNMTWIRS